MITVYTDGSCLGNPGPGGMGIVFTDDSGVLMQVGLPDPDTTNNRMELGATIYALKSLYKTDIYDNIVIVTDSNYVVKGATEWMTAWKKKNFKNVKNDDLWKEFNSYNDNMTITYKWVKGHADDYHNELADNIAVEAAKTQTIITR